MQQDPLIVIVGVLCFGQDHIG